MLQHAFKLNTSTMAILNENTQSSAIVTIPANALVTLVVGDIDAKGFVRVRYRDLILDMFAEDLRARGEPFGDNRRSFPRDRGLSRAGTVGP